MVFLPGAKFATQPPYADADNRSHHQDRACKGDQRDHAKYEGHSNNDRADNDHQRVGQWITRRVAGKDGKVTSRLADRPRQRHGNVGGR